MALDLRHTCEFFTENQQRDGLILRRLVRTNFTSTQIEGSMAKAAKKSRATKSAKKEREVLVNYTFDDVSFPVHHITGMWGGPSFTPNSIVLHFYTDVSAPPQGHEVIIDENGIAIDDKILQSSFQVERRVQFCCHITREMAKNFSDFLAKYASDPDAS